jgi:hypothetical protein
VIERRDFVPFFRSQPDVMPKLMGLFCARLFFEGNQQAGNHPTRDLPDRRQIAGRHEQAAACLGEKGVDSAGTAKRRHIESR